MLFLAHVLPLASKLILDRPGNDGIDGDVGQVSLFRFDDFLAGQVSSSTAALSPDSLRSRWRGRPRLPRPACQTLRTNSLSKGYLIKWRNNRIHSLWVAEA